MRKMSRRLLGVLLAVIMVLGMNTAVFAAGSTLQISGNTAITQITQGKGCSITGTVSSNYTLTNVTGAIKDSSGNVKYSKSVDPAAKSYALKSSAIDNALKFGKLSVGSYTYTLSATDSSGKTLTLVNDSFDVVLAAGSGKESTLKITGNTTLTTLPKGKSWSLTGTVSSNYTLTNVTGSIKDSSGTVKYTKSVNPNAASYALKKSAIDNALSFGKLAAGSYHYVITAKDASGKSLTLVDDAFTVTTEDTGTTAADSTLKIEGATPLKNLVKGKSWSLTGTISSNYQLKNVTGKILDNAGNAKFTKAINPNATSYVLKGSAIDNALSFGKLDLGTYQYIITATDASGKSLTLVDNTFTVTAAAETGSSDTTKQEASTLKIEGATALTSLVKGKSWSLTGTITSNYNLVNVTGKILDSKGTAQYAKAVNPAAKKYVLKGGAIDNALSFGKLDNGTYQYLIIATDASGKTLTLVDNTFTVSASGTATGTTTGTTTDTTAGTDKETTEASTLKIVDAVAPTTIQQGNYWHCNGTITSNYKLVNVTGRILNNKGTSLYISTVNPDAVNYTLKYSTIDNGLSFSKLSAGSYRYTITATDASGKTLTLVDETFTVK